MENDKIILESIRGDIQFYARVKYKGFVTPSGWSNNIPPSVSILSIIQIKIVLKDSANNLSPEKLIDADHGGPWALDTFILKTTTKFQTVFYHNIIYTFQISVQWIFQINGSAVIFGLHNYLLSVTEVFAVT